MTELVEYIAKALVDKPDQVQLRSQLVEGVQVFELKVAPEDIGKVIGRDGRTVNALRTLMGTVGLKQGARVRLDIADDRRSGNAAELAPPGPDA